MISTAYLHEHDILDTFMEETYHIMNDVYDARNRLIAAENYIDEQVFMGESADDYQVMLEETKKNVFTRIGEAVIAFFKSLGEALKKFGSMMKDSLKNIKTHTSDEALKTQMRNNPELAKKFIDSVMSGNIKIHDVKDMDDLLKTAQELTDQLTSGKIDEEQYMDKVDKKLEKYASRAKNITAILGIVAGTTGILAFIDKISGGGHEMRLKTAESTDKFNALKEKMMREANKEAGGNSNRIAVWLKGQQKFAAAMSHDYSGWKTILANIEGKLGDLIGHINTGYNRKDKTGPIERVKQREKDAEEAFLRQERLKRELDDEYARKRENRNHTYQSQQDRQRRNQANRDTWHDIRVAYHKGYQQELGKMDARKSRNNNP